MKFKTNYFSGTLFLRHMLLQCLKDVYITGQEKSGAQLCCAPTMHLKYFLGEQRMCSLYIFCFTNFLNKICKNIQEQYQNVSKMGWNQVDISFNSKGLHYSSSNVSCLCIKIMFTMVLINNNHVILFHEFLYDFW